VEDILSRSLIKAVNPAMTIKQISAVIAVILSLAGGVYAQLFTDPNFATLPGNINVQNPTDQTIGPWTYGVAGAAMSQGQIQKITGGITIHSNDTNQGLAFAQQTSSSPLLANTTYIADFSIKNNGAVQLVGTGALSFTSPIFPAANGPTFVPTSFLFTTGATPGTETIQFESVVPGGGGGGPNIDLTAVSLSVFTPEPSSVIAVTLVLVGICATERRQLIGLLRNASRGLFFRLRGLLNR
jgi:hypothetical protein